MSEREERKKLIIEFAVDAKLDEITAMSKKMLKILSIEELAGIVACKLENTIVYIEKIAEDIDKEDALGGR